MIENLSTFQMTFWFCAVLGTGFFLINTALSFLSVDTSFDVSSHQVAHDGISSPDSAFQLISLTSLTGFFMMFGWVGLAVHDQMQLGIAASLVIAIAAGLVTMYLTAFIFKSARKLASSGATFDVSQTIGGRAIVYAKIPKDGKGQIQISVSGLTREIDAMGENGEEIDSNKNVEVVKAVDSSTVIVKIVG